MSDYKSNIASVNLYKPAGSSFEDSEDPHNIFNGPT